ncbi:TIGR03086 family metal-binding protein [Actinoplanes sp. M2I2]|uniref:TIGR03086 family metal-binding protein n=1 Tax=Actinoplanes sp. M2I2 TaxID=1734444 RepID=UPI0020212AD5|nr:TIGR03086 family metal-binding protein [Actinoplanes sp. M2I2]
MRILFSSVPAYGHLLALLPLARAAVRAGHEVALLTHPSMGAAAPSLTLLAAGPSQAETLDGTAAEVLDPIEFFVERRIRPGAADAVTAARRFGPDLVVADHVDYLGQYAAAVLGVPWAAHGSTLPLVEPLAAVFAERAGASFRELGVEPARPVAYLDPWPDSLLRSTDSYPADRIPVRPEPHTGDGPAWLPPRFDADRPLVLVSLGTVVDDPALLRTVVAQIAAYDVNVLVAPQAAGDLDSDRVRTAGFVPMRDLLAVSDLVVSAGGAGTVLSTLGAGLPSVLLPLGLDKPVNAERAAATGAAYVVSGPDQIGPAVDKLLRDDAARAAAQTVAAGIAAMPSPADALESLLRRAFVPAAAAVLESVADLVAGTTDDQAALATPCDGMDVGALQRHLLGWLAMFGAAFADPTGPQRPDPAAYPAGQTPREAAAEVRRIARTVATALTDAQEDQDISLPALGGTYPLQAAVGLLLAEALGHGWDLAVATGRQWRPDPMAAEQALAVARTVVQPAYRGEGMPFGAEVAIDSAAPALDRLVAFLGRDPGSGRR